MELTDVHEVALLRTLGFEEEDVNMRGGKVFFKFGEDAGTKLNEAHRADVQVSWKKYKHAVKDVRDLVFGMRRSRPR